MKSVTRLLFAATALTVALAAPARATEEQVFRKAVPTQQCSITICIPTGWDCESENCLPFQQLCCQLN